MKTKIKMTQEVWRGHTGYLVCLTVANSMLWSGDRLGYLIGWNRRGEIKGKLEVFNSMPISQMTVHQGSLYCISVDTGMMVLVNPKTIKKEQQILISERNRSMDAIASVQDYLWVTSDGVSFIFYDNKKVQTLPSIGWIRALLAVQDTCWLFPDEGPIQVWTKDGTRRVRTIKGMDKPLCACLSDEKVWSGNRNGDLEVLSLTGDRILFYPEAHRNSIWDFTVFGKTVFSGSCDGLVSAWKISKKGNLKLVKAIPNMCSMVYCVKILDGKLCGGGRDQHNVIVTHDAALDWAIRRVIFLGCKSKESPFSRLPFSVVKKILTICDKWLLRSVSIQKVL